MSNSKKISNQILRYNLEDSGQDLIFIDVNFGTSHQNIGIIKGGGYGVLIAHMKRKAFNKDHNKIGEFLNFADPHKDFAVTVLKYRIVEIADISTDQQKEN